jgi:hypothetical protein
VFELKVTFCQIRTAIVFTIPPPVEAAALLLKITFVQVWIATKIQHPAAGILGSLPFAFPAVTVKPSNTAVLFVPPP